MLNISLAQKKSVWTNDFIIILFSNLLTILSFQMLLPTLPVYITQHSGSSSDIGLVIGIFALSALLIRPFSGVASDTVGRKKLLVIGVIINIIVIGGYSWTTTVSTILLMRIIHGIGWGISTAAFGTMASDLVPITRRGEGIGYFGLAAVIAGSIGPLLGIWLLNSFGPNVLFTCSAIITLLSLFLLLLVNEPVLEVGPNSNDSASFLAKLIEKSSLFPAFLTVIVGVIFGGVITFITLFGTEVGIKNIGWFFLVNAFGSLLIRPMSGKLFDKKGHLYILIPSVLFLFIGILLLSYSTTLMGLIVAAIFYGIGMGSIMPSIQAWIINRAAPNRRGAATAIYYSAFDLGIGGGAIILGSVARVTNYALMYRLSSLCLIVFMVVYIIYVLRPKNKKISF